MPKSTGFSGYACVYYRYVGSRRPRPGLLRLSSFSAGAVAQEVYSRTRSYSLEAPRLRTFYRTEVYPPEPPISACQAGRNPNKTSLQTLTLKGGARGFLRQLKQAVPAS